MFDLGNGRSVHKIIFIFSAPCLALVFWARYRKHLLSSAKDRQLWRIKVCASQLVSLRHKPREDDDDEDLEQQ